MNKDDEQVLVVPSSVIFKDGLWQGIKTDNLDYYLELIKNNYLFKRRGDVENDDSFQQIIPYIVFSHKDKFFLYKYVQGAGEQRLVNNYQLGVGGHINIVDVKEGEDVLEAAALREWFEEVDFKGNIIDKKLIGILNDSARPVEKVHIGMIYHFTGDNDDISVKETDKLAGKMTGLDEINKCVEGIQGWAPIVYQDYLSKLK
jgi:predicted NUDIX family phosphoesterase